MEELKLIQLSEDFDFNLHEYRMLLDYIGLHTLGTGCYTFMNRLLFLLINSKREVVKLDGELYFRLVVPYTVSEFSEILGGFDKKSLQKYRKILEENGLIKYLQGGKSIASQFFIPLEIKIFDKEAYMKTLSFNQNYINQILKIKQNLNNNYEGLELDVLIDSEVLNVTKTASITKQTYLLTHQIILLNKKLGLSNSVESVNRYLLSTLQKVSAESVQEAILKVYRSDIDYRNSTGAINHYLGIKNDYEKDKISEQEIQNIENKYYEELELF